MKRLVAMLLAVTLTAAGAAAQEVLLEIRDAALESASEQGSAEMISPAELLIRSRGAVSQKFPLLNLEQPDITQDRFAITGRERHDLSGRGYFEMVAEFANGERVITRHSDESGPRSALVGSSDWREFTLPFYLNDAALGRPTAVTLSVVLPFRGVVQLHDLRLVQFTPEDDPLAFSGQWWPPRTSLLIIVALATGALTAFAIVALLARQGSAKPAALGVLGLMAGLGCLLIGLGILALRAAQPGHVSLPLLVAGGIVMGGALIAGPRILTRYRENELRRMRALDAH